jgi:glucose 1-dehydrogenase
MIGLAANRRSSVRLQGKVALVTGASHGIGQATAVALAGEGAKVGVNYNRSPQGAEETVRRIREAGGEAEAIQADMGEVAEIERLVAATVERFGRLDVYVNNANAGRRGRDLPRNFLDVQPDQIEQEYFLPYRACYVGGQLAAQRMIEQGGGGAIVNITSVHQDRAWPNDSLYGSMKAAISRLTRSQAVELAPHGIRVNAVAPGFIDIRAFPGERGERYDMYNVRAEAELPLGRGVPNDIANGVIYLVSDASRYVTGQTIFIEGGFLLAPISEI